MTDMQAEQIINEVMKAHWPNWNFAGQELRVWIEELRKYDYETAKNAINELYKSWEKDRYPKMPHILGSIRRHAQARRRADKRLVPLFEITRQDGTRRWWPFVGDANSPRELVSRRAEQIQQQANRLYPTDKHIVFYLNTEEKEELKGDYGPGARQRAIDSILAGPDTKTKLWLQKHFSKAKRKINKEEPVAIGDVIPF